MTAKDKAVAKLEREIKKHLKTIDGLKETLTVIQRTALEAQRSALKWECAAKENVFHLALEGLGNEIRAEEEWHEAEGRLKEFLGK